MQLFWGWIHSLPFHFCRPLLLYWGVLMEVGLEEVGLEVWRVVVFEDP